MMGHRCPLKGANCINEWDMRGWPPRKPEPGQLKRAKRFISKAERRQAAAEMRPYATEFPEDLRAEARAVLARIEERPVTEADVDRLVADVVDADD